MGSWELGEGTGLAGARYRSDGSCEFVVWAPEADEVSLVLAQDRETVVPMARSADGWHRLLLAEVAPGTRYSYLLGGNKRRPDPASRFQPEGVHGASEVVDPVFQWTDEHWINPPLAEYIFYELHTGTFSAEGTLAGIIPRLRYLKDLGVTAIELMPVAQFPGRRNWGYDGVFPSAVQNSYGGPGALKQLVNAAHGEGLAIVLDVVYNHLGPEGNYLRDFGPYFTGRYQTPWGEALNFDGPDSDEVRRFFIESAVQWVTEFHLDGLRLDAIHAIADSSARPFMQELTHVVQEQAGSLGRRVYIIAESDLNDVRVIQPESCGGLGCDASWSDDFHHALHALLTGERGGYYQDFGTVAQLATAYTEGYVYSGQYSPFRRRRHGNSARNMPGERFVVCAQNHDQIGNRSHGERLSALADFEALKLAAGATLLSPYLPLLFMGEEYGETAPFPYFTSHGDEALIDAVRRGRIEEFAAFSWKGDLPDPQDEETFLRARLTPEQVWNESQRVLCDFYREVIRLRKKMPALARLAMEQCEATPLDDHTLMVRRWHGANEVALFLNFADCKRESTVRLPSGEWSKVLDSAETRWNGPGGIRAGLTAASGQIRVGVNGRSIAVFEKQV